MFKYLAVFFLAFFCAGTSYAEELKITTYYPSPYGVYNTLRLFPGTTHDPSAKCTIPGEMFYYNGSAAAKGLYFCEEDGSWWKPFGAGNAGLWNYDNASPSTIWNTNTGTVRVGVNESSMTGGKLQIHGGVADDDASLIGLNQYLSGNDASIAGIQSNIECGKATSLACEGANITASNISPYGPVTALNLASTASLGNAYGLSVAAERGDIAYGALIVGNGGYTETYGVRTHATGASTGRAYGLFSSSKNGINNWSGYFSSGNVYVNDNLGIGTAYPTKKLEVIGKSYFSDNVGVGTTNPTQALEVSGNVFIRGGNTGIDINNQYVQTKAALNVYRQIRVLADMDNLQIPDWIVSPEGKSGNESSGILISQNTDDMFIGLRKTDTNVNESTILYGDDTATSSTANAADSFVIAAINYSSISSPNWNVIERVRIDPSGNVGIGTSKPTYALEVKGNVHVKGAITATGLITPSSSSDRRLKTDIVDVPSSTALDKLTALQAREYRWINPKEHGDSKEKHVGIMAQDLGNVFPGWVGSTDPTGEDARLLPAGEKALTVSYPFDFNAYVVEALKELKKRNEELTKKVDVLEQELKDVKARKNAEK